VSSLIFKAFRCLVSFSLLRLPEKCGKNLRNMRQGLGKNAILRAEDAAIILRNYDDFAIPFNMKGILNSCNFFILRANL